jgi:hypothetical protein
VTLVVTLVLMLGAGASSAQAGPAARHRVRATLAVTGTTFGKSSNAVVQVVGARIGQAVLFVGSASTGYAMTVDGSWASGQFPWPAAGSFTLQARVQLVSGRTVNAYARVDVGLPRSGGFQLVYVYPADASAVPGRADAITHSAGQVRQWYSGQLDGRAPMFVTDGAGVPSVITLQAPMDKSTLAVTDVGKVLVPGWKAAGLIPADSVPVLFIDDVQPVVACGWSTAGANAYIAIPMETCRIWPKADDTFPYGATYLLAHEMLHQLGAVSAGAPHYDGSGHVNDDPRDLLYFGTQARDWQHLALDPNHDDYYLTGRGDLANVESSPLLD